MAEPLAISDEKHPLENKWVLWYDSRRLHANANDKNWMDTLQIVATFSTVEDFWSTYNHIKRPGDLEYGANYHMFKDKIKPMWEDDANKKGGKWVVTLSKEDAARIDDLWELLLLSMIGEYLDEGVAGDQICGAVLSRRKPFPRLSVWTRDTENMAAVKSVGSRIRSVLKLTDKTLLEYQSHADALQSGCSYKNEAKVTC